MAVISYSNSIVSIFQEWHKIPLDDLESKLDTDLTKVSEIIFDLSLMVVWFSTCTTTH